ncbi:MAG: hypothetical protein E7241_08030 [Lachnospiraceae bacterium]|jgi:predicted RNA-binding Zn-ribbon protein involved in translation (DUF1610 family)|nr:hypothetical protein [Lachnospiraceae bacterium]
MSDIQEHKCPCCGGGIHFDTGIQKLKCPYCETEFDIDAIEAIKTEAATEAGESRFHWDKVTSGQWAEGEQLYAYSCTSCGAQIMADATLAATKCPYCDNPVVMTDRFDKGLKPDYVIPFKLDKKAAIAGLQNHLKGKTLLPKVFKDQNHIEEIKGLYVPFWLYDTNADADINYRATRTRAWSDSEYDYIETSHYSIYRAGTIDFETIPVDGSSKMPDDLMESIEPFDFSQAVPFRTEYLAGFLADRYDVDAEASEGRANERVQRSVEEEFAGTVVGYETVIPAGSDIRLTGGSVKYALYPVWILSTKWKDQNFLFAMNGQTGKFVGDLPKDTGKAVGIFAGVFAVAAAIAFAAQYIFWLI